MRKRSDFQTSCDVLVVGAGPAGIFATLALTAAGRRVLLVDRGPAVEDRIHPALDGSTVHGDYESGVGGAGLFSDGKLCLSLDVGGHLEESLSDRERAHLLDEIESVFSRLLGDEVRDAHDEPDIDDAKRLASEVGLTYKYYPVAHIGTDRCGDVIRDLIALLREAGATIRAGCELEDLRVGATGEKLATLRLDDGARQVVEADAVVLAFGKVGAARQAEICERLGIGVETQPLYVGTRLEAPAPALDALFRVTRDPKYSIRFADGSKLKTHCASEQGEVLALRYEGYPLAGGHNFADHRTGRSGFSLLWDGMATEGRPYERALEIMGRVDEITGGRLLVQSLADYRNGVPSTAESLRGIPLTRPDGVPGDVRRILPEEYFERCDELLTRLELLSDEITFDGSVLYAPAIEWWMKRVAVDSRSMETAVSGVFVSGDGSGWSQGIVHAAATGLVAASGVTGEPVSISGWLPAGEGLLAAATAR